MTEETQHEANGTAKAEAPPSPPPTGKGAEHVTSGPKPVRMTELEKQEVKRLYEKLGAKQGEFALVALEIERLSRLRKELYDEVQRADTDFKARCAEACVAHGLKPEDGVQVDWGTGVLKPKGA